MREAAAAAPSTSRGVGADAETETAEQEARAPAAEAGAEAEAVDDPAPEDGMPGLHQVIDGEDDDERIVHEPTDPSEPRCPSGDSSSEKEEEAIESHSKSQTFSARTSPQSSAAMSSALLGSAAAPA